MLTPLDVSPLRAGLGFGARVRGVNHEGLRSPELRGQLNRIFEDRGLIVFEDVEPTSAMHVALSNVFGPLKEHPVPTVGRVDSGLMPGVIDMKHDSTDPTLVELGGKVLDHWLPWHFDHCYNNELNRAGVLRAIDISPEGGMTGFADGIQLYRACSPDLLAAIEPESILYRLNVVYESWRFGRPARFRCVSTSRKATETNAFAQTLPRAIHPAVWTRSSGEKVLHVSPWMAEGVEGRETPEGDHLLEAVCQEVFAKADAYFHRWNTTDMLIWDNWRVLHCVSGTPPQHPRRMHRTTIRGDYGLGRFESNKAGHAVLENTMV
jgi:taurine dioxygenase